MKNQDRIINYILEHITVDPRHTVAKTVENFNVSKSTVYNYIHTLEDKNIIVRDENNNYKLYDEDKVFVLNNDGKLKEERVFDTEILPFISEVPSNVVKIWRYSFTEILNNAIEHSQADTIRCFCRKNIKDVTILIDDNGIGIFKNIQNYFKEFHHEDITLDEAVAMLFAGKLTTMKDAHSGEGIFFTSQILDDFLIMSDSKIFCRDNFDAFLMDSSVNKSSRSGTSVFMRLSCSSKKELSEIFNIFSTVEEGFIRTKIPILHIFTGGFPVSRSEARRLCAMIFDFKEAILDFAGVEEIGQAFAHELFVVFKKSNPNVSIKIENAAPNVEFMIKRVINTKYE